MKFARFEFKGKVSFGVVKDDRVIVLKGSILDRFEEGADRFPLSEVKLLPPVVPTKIVCIGLNYREHIEEIGAKVPEIPHFFLKPTSALIGHNDAIMYPGMAERVDYEGELAVVIREKMKDVPEEEALKYVLGYSCFNDVTERAFVSRDVLNLGMSKGFDTFACLGPYVATGLDPDNLELKTYLNGTLMQHSNTRNFVFSIRHLLHFISKCMTLLPGDIISTGTPSGVAAMKPGDVVEVEVEGVGKLRNTVRAA
jgi:2-keto-4-pentenoate hydratase/2-oxohepta-3-ene-1,7-dioic acid hydratase in catechol pathway